MSDEQVVDAPVVETPAATPEPVATPATETQDAPEVKTEAEKTFTQAELDEIVQKRVAKATATAERRALKERVAALESRVSQPVEQKETPNGRPTRAQFTDDDDYVEAMTDWKIGQRDAAAQHEQRQRDSQTTATKTEKIYAEASKITGFDREAFDELPLTPAIAAALVDSDIPAKLMHYMAANPEEVEKISQMSPARQAAAIGKMEDKVSSDPAISKAPPPMKPVGSRGSSANNDLAKASMEEYMAARAKQGARWARK